MRVLVRREHVHGGGEEEGRGPAWLGLGLGSGSGSGLGLGSGSGLGLGSGSGSGSVLGLGSGFKGRGPAAEVCDHASERGAHDGAQLDRRALQPGAHGVGAQGLAGRAGREERLG